MFKFKKKKVTLIRPSKFVEICDLEGNETLNGELNSYLDIMSSLSSSFFWWEADAHRHNGIMVSGRRRVRALKKEKAEPTSQSTL